MMQQEIEQDDLETEEFIICDCGNQGELRACPYKLELSGIPEEDIEPCECCQCCANQCAMDI